MNLNKIPTDAVYEQGLQIGNVFYKDLDTAYNVNNKIDWSKPIDTPKETQELTAATAVHSHYSNMSHLMLCGQIIAMETESDPLKSQKYAVKLSQFKMNGIDAWGRYIRKTDANIDIIPEMRDYFGPLFSDTNALSRLLGMATYGGVTAHTLFTSQNGFGDELFNDILDHLIKQKETEIQMARDQLAPAIKELDEEQKQHVNTTAMQCRTNAMKLVTGNETHFDARDMSQDVIRGKLEQALKSFHDSLGIDATNGIELTERI